MILRSFSCLSICRKLHHLNLLPPRQLNSFRFIVTTQSIHFNQFVKNLESPQHTKTCLISAPELFKTEKIKYRWLSSKNDPTKGEHFENVLTIPNVLTVSRMAMCPILGYLVVQGNYSTAFSLFIVAGITDLLDGWVARTFPSQASRAGSFLDPLADKLLIGTLFITLTISGLIPVPLTALIVTRDFLLIAAAFIIRYISLPPPKTLKRYFDVTLVSAQLAPTGISKFNTAMQLLLVAGTLGASAIDCASSPLLPFLWYATGTTTVLSGLGYVFFAKNTYRILSRPRAK